MNDSPEPDERPVEKALRELLDPLDRHLERGRTLLAGALVLVVPAAFLLLWLVWDMAGKFAAGWAVVALGVLVVLGLGWEMVMERLVRWRFDRRFPHGSVTRGVALRILSQMETPNKAEEKLRGVLSSTSPERIVRHRSGSADEQPLPLLELPPAQPEPPVPPASTPPSTNKATRPGGYYDYIPLEPRPVEDRAADSRAGP